MSTTTRSNGASTTQYQEKNPGNVAGGLKAALHNPNVSEEAKERASERLQEMGATETSSGYSEGENITNNDIDYAREILEAAGYSVEKSGNTSEEEHQTRVLAGYKAALSNPRVSQDAKRHAQQYLQQHGGL